MCRRKQFGEISWQGSNRLVGVSLDFLEVVWKECGGAWNLVRGLNFIHHRPPIFKRNIFSPKKFHLVPTTPLENSHLSALIIRDSSFFIRTPHHSPPHAETGGGGVIDFSDGNFGRGHRFMRRKFRGGRRFFIEVFPEKNKLALYGFVFSSRG